MHKAFLQNKNDHNLNTILYPINGLYTQNIDTSKCRVHLYYEQHVNIVYLFGLRVQTNRLKILSNSSYIIKLNKTISQ